MVPGVAVRFWGAQGVATVKMEVGIVLSRITIMITAASRHHTCVSCKRQGQKYLLKLPFKRDFYSSLLQEIIEQVFSMLIILSFFFYYSTRKYSE